MGDSVTNWLTAIFAFLSLIAFIWLQSKQTNILKKQATIQEVQTGIQAQQLEIQKRQTDITDQQTEIARRQLAITEHPEQQRWKDSLKADLKAQSVWKSRRLLFNIKNEGKAEASDIKILVNDKEVWMHPVFKPYVGVKEGLPKSLSPGASWEHEMYSVSGVDNRFRVKISWSDDSGEPGYFEQFLVPVTQ